MIEVSEKLKNKILEVLNKEDLHLYYIDNELINNKEHLIIYINKVGYESISIDECVLVTNEINKFIDDYIDQEYILEVSSSGIYRTLYTKEHLKEAIDQNISINLFKKLQGHKNRKYEGVLEKVEEKFIVVDGIDINFDNINRITYIGREND